MNRPIRILAVDDDPTLLAVLEAGLRLRDDCHITPVAQPRAALAELERSEFDLLVTDYALGDPEYNGLDVMRAAHARPHRPLAIIITAFATHEISLEAIGQGAYDFLTKPFQLEELQLVVRNAIRQIHLEQTNAELRRELAALIQALGEMETRQHDLLERLRQIEENYGAARPDVAPVVESLNGASVHGMRRRQVIERLTGYSRMAGSLLEQVQREQSRVQSLYEKGLLTEEEFRRLAASRGPLTP